MPTVADTLCVGLAALREAASTDVADTLVRGLGVVQSEGPDRALLVMPRSARAKARVPGPDGAAARLGMPRTTLESTICSPAVR